MIGLLKAYRKLDVNLQFNSAKHLPDVIKKVLGRESAMLDIVFKPRSMDGKWHEEDMAIFKTLCECLHESGIQIHFIVPGLAKVGLNIRGPKFSKWFL